MSCPASPIVLATLNAKYIHASLGLRYLLANMDVHGGKGLRAQTQLREFVIQQRPTQIVEELLALQPKVIGLGIYIWNVVETTQVVRLLKTLRPDIKIVLGGPEVSHEVDQQEICRLADHVITGWGDVSFARLCRALLDGPRPLMKVIAGEQPALGELALPYDEYTAEDLAKRLLYVEASRGCPFKCEFCLSSLDKTAWAFELDRFMGEMDTLYQRGARNFKFVDRTFNLNIATGRKVLEFFLERYTPGMLIHFEMIPDRLPEGLRTLIRRFPPGALQFEVGIQTFDAEVAQRISRRQNYQAVTENLTYLRGQTGVHIHADLIAGLPGETLESFARGFDTLVALQPHEIQVGILKRLRGTPIIRHDGEWGMVYSPEPPYEILRTSTLDFMTLQNLRRFAKHWDLIHNSGNFVLSTPLVWINQPSPFWAFWRLSAWLTPHTGSSSGVSLKRLATLLARYLITHGVAEERVRTAIIDDFKRLGRTDLPQFGEEGSRAPTAHAVPGTHRQHRHHAQPG